MVRFCFQTDRLTSDQADGRLGPAFRERWGGGGFLHPGGRRAAGPRRMWTLGLHDIVKDERKAADKEKQFR